MDTTHLEYKAEDLISHKLMQAGILVAKPKFDREGTDLLGFLEIGDGVKFCRIQCKGRSLAVSDSNIRVPCKYVTNGFVIFLYVEESEDHSELFCFLRSDIESWFETQSSEYQLSLSRSNYKSKLASCRFDQTKIKLIQALIQQAEVSGEFRPLIYGSGNITLSPIQLGGDRIIDSP